MASLTYVDRGERQVSILVYMLLQPGDHSEGLRDAERLAQLLLLSNHIDQAYKLICALYKQHKIIPLSWENGGNSFRVSSRPFANFWVSHRTYALPEDLSEEDLKTTAAQQAQLATHQWRDYRECTRTGWMLDHCNLPEPTDPHVWRETNNAPMIAMCARLLAKDKTPGHYPSLETMREALAAAKKLYAQPQVPVSEWQFEMKGSQTIRRHSYLLYRRLVVELAIRVGDLKYAAEVLSMGLRLDGFNYIDGGDVDRYLFVPGIYSVLPLLAEKGKEGNPFFIEHERAVAIVEEVTAALNLRVRDGRQGSLSADKVGWKELMERLARAAWAVNSKEFERNGLTCAEDILHPPASEEAIAEAESRVGELPTDFKEMVRVSNGFEGGWSYLAGGLAGIDGIDIADQNEIDQYIHQLGDMADCDDDILSKIVSLPPAMEECDGGLHFMIPPQHWRGSIEGDHFSHSEYPYWHWISWNPPDHIWHSLRDWIASEVEQAEMMAMKGLTVYDP